MARASRARQPYDWGAVLDRLAAGSTTIEVKRPPHLTIYQTRDKLVELAGRRGMTIETRICMGYLDAELAGERPESGTGAGKG